MTIPFSCHAELDSASGKRFQITIYKLRNLRKGDIKR